VRLLTCITDKNPFTGLQSVLSRIPRTKGLHLDQAILRVAKPETTSAEYPLRPTQEERTSGPTAVAGPSSFFPSNSHQGEGAKIDKTTTPKGIMTPYHSKDSMKYSSSGVPSIVKRFLKIKYNSMEENKQECWGLLQGSLAKSTWKRYSSALALWKTYAQKSQLNWQRIRGQGLTGFIGWCKLKRKISAGTVRIYLSSLKKLKTWKEEWKRGEGNELEKILLRGYQKLGEGNKRNKKPRKTEPVNLEILDKIQKGIKRTGWAHGSRKCVWAACLVAFWGSFRLGEIFANKMDCFDKYSDLLWNDIKVKKGGEMILKIRGSKTPGPPGNRARLYRIQENRFCPITALEKLKAYQKIHNLWKPNLPVFRRASGQNLTKTIFLKSVNYALASGGRKSFFLTGKSFRSGIPSVLENFPQEFHENHIKSLGRWKSQAYQRYMRNDSLEFKWVFGNIANLLIKNYSETRREKETDQEGSSPDS
jgi:hypothetical protein